MMIKKPLSPGAKFFGNNVDFECFLQDLKIVLRKTEAIEFPMHEGVSEDESLIFDIFPDITRKSFIVMLLIALDDQFRIYSEILQEACGQKLKWTELRGSALDRFVTYAERVCGLGPICNQNLRRQIQGLIELRNCIVHNNSGLDGFAKAESVKRFIRETRGFAVLDGYVSIDLAGCYSCSNLALTFMDKAYGSALRRFKR